MSLARGRGCARPRCARRRATRATKATRRHASRLELFFDLVFVVAIAELAQELAPHAVAARPLIARYAGGYSLSIALWLLSLLVDPPVRYVLWGVGLAIEYAMPVVAQRIHARIPVDPSHVPERFALFTTSSSASRSSRWRSGPPTRTGAWPRR